MCLNPEIGQHTFLSRYFYNLFLKFHHAFQSLKKIFKYLTSHAKTKLKLFLSVFFQDAGLLRSVHDTFDKISLDIIWMFIIPESNDT